MKETEKALKHVNCGGVVREVEKGRYVCDQCKAEAPAVITSSERVEGEPEEVTLCNSQASF